VASCGTPAQASAHHWVDIRSTADGVRNATLVHWLSSVSLLQGVWWCFQRRIVYQKRLLSIFETNVLLPLCGTGRTLCAFLLIDSGSDESGYCLEDLDALERPSYRWFQFSDLLLTTTLGSLLQRHAQQLSWQPKLNPGIERVESCIKGGAKPREPVI